MSFNLAQLLDLDFLASYIRKGNLQPNLKSLLSLITTTQGVSSRSARLKRIAKTSSVSTGEVTSLLCQVVDVEIDIPQPGRLVLALEKDTYELLGLEGRPSRFGSPRQKYSPSPSSPQFPLTQSRTTVVEINLLKPSFRAGKAGFERIKEKLANWPESTSIFHQLSGPSAPSSSAGRGRKFDMDFVWVDEDGQSFPFAEASVELKVDSQG